jgi:hypothetical protein
MPTTLQNPGDYAIFVSNTPYDLVSTVDGFTDSVVLGPGSVLTKEFSWSFDNKSFSAYEDLTNSSNYELINVPSSEVWVKFRYTLDSGSPVTINSIVLDITQYTVPAPPARPNPVFNAYRIGNVKGTMFLNSFNYNPYAVGEVIQMVEGLSTIINQQFGIESNYYRATVDDFGTDVVLREYALQNVQPPKCLKIVVPNNELPDANYSFSPFGVDFSGIPFEVHIDKKYFESVFGVGAKPQKRDIVYFPLMDKIYEVMDSYLSRNFMQSQLFYKVSLYKWSPRTTNVIVPSTVPDSENPLLNLDEIARSTKELFQEEQDLQEKKYTDKQQFVEKSVKFDLLRSSINPNLVIIEQNLENYFNVLTNFRYDMSSILPTTGNGYDIGVEYDLAFNWPSNSNRTFTAWFKDNTPPVSVKTYENNFISISRSTTTGYVSIVLNQKIKDVSMGDSITMYSIRNSFSIPFNVVEVNQIGSNWEYVCDVPSDYFLYYDSASASWMGYIEESYPQWFTVPSSWQIRFKKSYKNYFITADTLFEISSYNLRYFLVRFGNIETWYDVESAGSSDPLDPSTFYAIVYSRSKEFNQTLFNIWKMSDPNETVDLDLVYSSLQESPTYTNLSSTAKYVLRAGPSVITNIRLMDTIIPEEQQSMFLNQTIVLDADSGMIIDNAIPQIRSPYIGKSV